MAADPLAAPTDRAPSPLAQALLIFARRGRELRLAANDGRPTTAQPGTDVGQSDICPTTASFCRADDATATNANGLEPAGKQPQRALRLAGSRGDEQRAVK